MPLPTLPDEKRSAGLLHGQNGVCFCCGFVYAVAYKASKITLDVDEAGDADGSSETVEGKPK